MSDDPYAAVKAILDGEAKTTRQSRQRDWDKINRLRAACEEITKLQQDEHGNGTKLAIAIAKAVLEETGDY